MRSRIATEERAGKRITGDAEWLDHTTKISS
jgi:hypothetical protein